MTRSKTPSTTDIRLKVRGGVPLPSPKARAEVAKAAARRWRAGARATTAAARRGRVRTNGLLRRKEAKVPGRVGTQAVPRLLGGIRGLRRSLVARVPPPTAMAGETADPVRSRAEASLRLSGNASGPHIPPDRRTPSLLPQSPFGSRLLRSLWCRSSPVAAWTLCRSLLRWWPAPVPWQRLWGILVSSFGLRNRGPSPGPTARGL